MSHTFASLAGLDNKALDAVMLTGTAPAIADVLGFEFRGWNNNAATTLLGNRKFRKGFFGDPEALHAWGYNVPVRGSRFDEPWVAEPSDADPTRHYFFGVLTAAQADRPTYANSLVVDYRKWRYPVVSPVRYTVDYLVYPEPGNRDLILGKSYAETPIAKPFLGYFVLERHNASGYGRRSAFLSDDELATVRAFAEAFFEGPEFDRAALDAIRWNVDHHLARMRTNRTASVKLLLQVIEHALPRRTFPFVRPRFSRMSVADRRRFIRDTIATPKNRGALRDLAKVRTLITAGYYLDPATHQALGFVPVPARPHLQGKLIERRPVPLQVTVPGPGSIAVRTCVIGSGAAGAIVAAHRAARGSVALLEEGPYVPTTLKGLPHDEARATTRLFKEGGLQSTVDLDMTILQGKCLGGSTTINNAICFALLDDPNVAPGAPDILAEWRAFGATLDVTRLRQSFAGVQRRIGVGELVDIREPGVPPLEGGNGRILLKGWNAVRQRDPSLAAWTFGPMRKNYERCLGCGYCNFGCPYGRKLSMMETYLPDAIAAGASVYTECHAVRIETAGRRAVRVVCDTPGGTFTVTADEVVVACGTIGSSMLLMKSGITRNVGTRVSFNAGSPVFARFAERIDGFDGLQIATFVDHGEFLLESLFYPPLAFSSALPGWFRDHRERMLALRHFASAGVLVGTLPNGTLRPHGALNGLTGPLDWKMDVADLEKMRKGLARLTQVYFAAGATEVYPSTFADVRLRASDWGARPYDDLLAHYRTLVTRPEDLTLSSAHPQGGNPMSDDQANGVVDSRFRVHGFDNLYVCDASVFPTSARINPQITVMGMADYFGSMP